MRPQAEAPARGVGTRIGASRLSALAAGCWLLLLTLLLHHSALDGYWRFDDGWLLDYASRFAPWEYWFDPAVTRGYSPNNLTPWNPFLFDINLALFGFSPAGFYGQHLATLAAVAWASFLLLRLWLGTAFALLGASAFLLGAPVLQVAQQLMVGHYLLGLLFAIFALYAFVRGVRARRWQWVAGGTLCYVMASACKEVFVPLPGLLPLLGEGDLRTRLRYALPFFAWSLAYLGWRYQVLGTLVGGYTGAPLDPGGALSQLGRIPLWLFGDDLPGLAALALLAIVLAWTWAKGSINGPLLLVALLLLLLPLVPLTANPGIKGPDRYLLLPWWALSMLLAWLLGRLPRPAAGYRLLLGAGLLAVAGLHGQRALQPLQPSLERFDRLYRAALEAGPGQVLLLERGDLRFWDVTLNGARRAQAAVAGRLRPRLALMTNRRQLALVDPDRYTVWAYHQGCGCWREIAPWERSDGAGTRVPARAVVVLPYGPPYPPLFEAGGGRVDQVRLDGPRVRASGWLRMGDAEPQQHLILLAPGLPVSRRAYAVPRPDVADALGAPELSHNGFRLELEYASAEAARAAAADLCLIAFSAFSGQALLSDPERPACRGLLTDRPLALGR